MTLVSIQVMRCLNAATSDELVWAAELGQTLDTLHVPAHGGRLPC